MKVGDLVINQYEQLRIVIDTRPCVRASGETETLLMSPTGDMHWYSTGYLCDVLWKVSDDDESR